MIDFLALWDLFWAFFLGCLLALAVYDFLGVLIRRLLGRLEADHD